MKNTSVTRVLSRSIATVCSLLTVLIPGVAATLQVGPGAAYKTPCAAIKAASAGDTILVDAAGSYNGDVCAWKKDNLTVRGINGRPHIDAAGASAQGKAIWVIHANNATVDNIELSGAHVSDRNGAGIRLEMADLTIRNSYFHDNDEGILTARDNIGTILIEYSEFGYNGFGDGLSHNMYINHADSFTLQYCYSHHANQGHLVKSRAKINYILYNRLSDEAGGAASYELDLPSGGPSYVIGNVFEQSLASPNNTIFSYLEEANNANNSVNPGQDLYVVNNTFVTEQSAGKFINIDPSVTVPAIVMNNIFAGSGTVVTQPNAQLSNNLSGVDPMFVNPANYDYHLSPNSPGIGAGGAPGSASNGFSLSPAFEYMHVGCNAPRNNANDLGAFVASNALPPVRCSSDTSAVPEPRMKLTLSGSTVVGGGVLTATVNVPGAAPNAQYAVSFSSSTINAKTPRTVTIPPGRSSATVSVPVAFVAASMPVTLIATSAGSSSSAALTIRPAAGNLVGVSKTSVALYNFALALSGPAPAGGAVVSLSSSNPAIAQAVASVIVPEAAMGASFSVPVGAVSAETKVTMTASYNGATQKVSFSVMPPVLAWVGGGAPSIVGGNGRNGSVCLTTAAPNGGMTVSLQSSDPATLAVPSSIVVNAGSNMGTFPITTNAVTASKTVTLSATYAGITRTTPVIVN